MEGRQWMKKKGKDRNGSKEGGRGSDGRGI